MNEPLKDQRARDRFRDEWQVNFAVSANAGSGKTTAISERLASMALSPEGSKVLSKTAVVTYTKKAASQIGQKARQVLLRRLETAGRVDLSPLDQLEKAFFGTIHSFCLLLAQRYGQPHGLNLNPRLLAEGEEDEKVFWEEFLEQDSMQFAGLSETEVRVFLRYVQLEDVFDVARGLNAHAAKLLLQRRPAGPLPNPSDAAYQLLQALPLKGNESAKKTLQQNKLAAERWKRQFESSRGFLGLYAPKGTAKLVVEYAEAWMAPLKAWLADAAAVVAGELAERYRVYRQARGMQTYADQIDAAMSVLHDAETLEKIRADGWRVILDEAQDTDSQQFAVLVEIARPAGAVTGSWPDQGGEPPRAGHFCMVGDGQQAIYRTRADIRNFTRHLKAFENGNGGELLIFQVTFRAPRAVVRFLNEGFPSAFGSARPHNLGLPPAEGVAGPLLQVNYEPLESGPSNEEGRVEVLPLQDPIEPPKKVESWLVEEARQVATFLKANGPASIGAKEWGEVCLLAPRNEWLAVYRDELEKAGVKTALQIRRNRSGDNPAYAWLTGLLTVICDPDNSFEWFGVLREVFAVSDALLAAELREKGAYQWDSPEQHPEPLRQALVVMKPWILQAGDEGLVLANFADGLANACALREKADAIDPSGALRSELERLLSVAATLGIEGAGPRQWQRLLIDEIDVDRAGGRPQVDAINLLSSHSAKGLEWPVVIVGGLWRPIGDRPERGIRLIPDTATERLRIYLQSSHVPAETVQARERERLRELVRLLYVTFTRSRKRLVLPWSRTFGQAQKRSKPSFAELWGVPELIEALPVVSATGASEQTPTARPPAAMLPLPLSLSEDDLSGLALPQRVLPHQLALKADKVRGARHEAAVDAVVSQRLTDGDEAIDYGVWWHETMEFTPWLEAEGRIAENWEQRLVLAEAMGFAARARAELEKLKASEAWREIRSGRWAMSPELAVFSPLASGEWIDGVMDLVLHDPAGRRIWILDWKTNHRRSMEEETAFLQRLAQEYAPQLRAYGESLRGMMPDFAVRLLVYSSFAGRWIEIESHP
jgi:ATP-dependent exoDNAse (exonuclease V) beta subunit